MSEAVAELQRKLAAQARTIAVLLDEGERKQQGRSLPVLLLEHNASLERIVAEKTRALEAAMAEVHKQHAERAGAQKLQAIGHLASGIAHEINTPSQYVSDNLTFLARAFKGLAEALAAHKQLADALVSGAPNESLLAAARATDQRVKLDFLLLEIPRALEQSLEGLGRVSSIVGAMKEFSHPSGGVKVPSDLNEMIRTTLAVSRNEWKYVADIALDLDAGLGAVPCLRDEMNQVLLNLVVNAAHAIGEATHDGRDGKGTIAITTRRLASAAELSICDTGTGIAEGVRDRVFDPFFTTKPIGKGTGQGLAIARSIVVDKHGGSIDFESRPGAGTTFFVRLPSAAPEEMCP